MEIILDRREIVFRNTGFGLDETDYWKYQLEKNGYKVQKTISASKIVLDGVRYYTAERR